MVRVWWGGIGSAPSDSPFHLFTPRPFEAPGTIDPINGAYFIDNITFHPVPGPGTFARLAVGVATLAVGRRWVI